MLYCVPDAVLKDGKRQVLLYASVYFGVFGGEGNSSSTFPPFVVGDFGYKGHEKANILKMSSDGQMRVIYCEIFAMVRPSVITLIADFHFLLIKTTIQSICVFASQFSFKSILDVVIVILVEHNAENADIFGAERRLQSSDVALLAVIRNVYIVSYFEFNKTLLHVKQLGKRYRVRQTQS